VARSRRLRVVSEYNPDDEPVVLDPNDEMSCDRCLRDRKRKQLKRIEGTSHKGGTFYIWVCRARCEFVR
jgi:hypothetical protein